MRISDTSSLKVVTFEPARVTAAIDSRMSGLASARRLLTDLGHSVTESETLVETDSALREEGAVDLFLADVRTDAEASTLAGRLADIPVQDRPAHVVLVTTTTSLNPAQLRQRLSPTHVHVLPQPIHLHGLLHVVRQLEKNSLV